MNIGNKCTDVVVSCKTKEQLDCALRYIKLARKSNKIGRDFYHVLYGSIFTLKGVYGRGINDEQRT